MLNKIRKFVRQYQLIQPGDQIVCAVSGGADSVALLFALFLLRDSIGFTLSAAHFNHCLRGSESDRDETFVRQFCEQLNIPLHVGKTPVVAGKKGLEAAARDARYSFFGSLSGKIATAHTADDNAETVLMHMVRGTGLKGLGGIAPKNGSLIRPMLTTTRQDVMTFIKEYHLTFVLDSTNETDLFLRNRLRHHVMPLLQQENPRLSENLSVMALRLRDDELVLNEIANAEHMPDVPTLRQMPQALRTRCISAFLQRNGCNDLDSAHISLVNDLIFSDNPSAKMMLSETIQITRCYDKLLCTSAEPPIAQVQLSCPDTVTVGNIRITVTPAQGEQKEIDAFSVIPEGNVVLRCRQPGDTIRLPGGSKTLKKLFIERKIPAAKRCSIPVIADDQGVLGVYGIGGNLGRIGCGKSAIEIRFANIDEEK